MSHARNLICGGLSLLVVSSSGCAGNGLRNMFSRNETRGYSTLAELEAEEQSRAEEKSAVVNADDTTSSAARFASWIPFVGKSADKSTVERANAVVAAEDDNDPAARRWWQNPFRMRGTAETDPFLTADIEADDTESATDIARAETQTDEEAESGAPAENSARTDVALHSASDEESENALLADRFEQHFKRKTIDAAAESEHAEPLIVAGKTPVSTAALRASAAIEGAAGDKLAQLQDLLVDRPAAASRQARQSRSFAAEEAAELQQVSKEMADAGDSVQKSARHTLRTAQDTAAHAVNSFDNLLGAPAEVVGTMSEMSQKKSGSPARRTTSVAVDDADADDEKFRWTPSRLDALESRAASRAKQAIHATVDQFATMFQSRHNADEMPPASLNDPPETQFPSARNHSEVSRVDRKSLPAERTFRAVSSARALPGDTVESGLTADQFFSANGAANTITTNTTAAVPVAVVSSSKESSSGVMGGLTGRNWMLLIGGIIVVALLFAPGRKTAEPARHAPVQG